MGRNNFGLFFTRDGTVIRLPVNPEKLPVARGNENDEYNVLGVGPIMVPRAPSLRIVQISSFFPGRPFSGVLTSGGFEPPAFYIDFFQSAMTDRVPVLYTPVRYYEDGEPFLTEDTGFEVLVTKFDTEERGGETGDFYYDLELTEYRDYSPKRMQVQTQAETAGAAARSGLAAAQAGQAESAPLTVMLEKTRDIPAGQLYVGCTVLANGDYAAGTAGPVLGTLSGQQATVGRIAQLTAPYPVYLTGYGWVRQQALQVVRV